MTDENNVVLSAEDRAAIEAEVAKLSVEDLEKQLLDVRVRQKVQQKKQQDKGAQKAYMQKRNEKIKLMKELAAKKGLLGKINDEADAIAEQKFKELQEKEAAEAEPVEA